MCKSDSIQTLPIALEPFPGVIEAVMCLCGWIQFRSLSE